MRSYKAYGLILLVMVLGIVLTSPSSASAGPYWTKSYYLYQGQAVMHEIQVDCGAQLVLTSPFGGKFEMYAMKNYGPYGSCPSNEFIMTHYDETTAGGSVLYLDSGLWCVVVYAQRGNGQYLLEASKYCPGPYPTSTPMPPGPMPGPCSPYKTDTKSGYLYQGQSDVQAYSIGGSRNYIEWVLQGPCGNEIPVAMMSSDQVSAMRTSFCGPDFDLYIYKDCDPRYGNCYAQYADTSTGSNAYVGVTYPRTGSTYYAQVYAKSGSGQYTLVCRSYSCSDDVVVMMAEPAMSSTLYTASSIPPPVAMSTESG